MSERYYDMGTAARALNMGRNKLFSRLRQEHILMYNNLPYQVYIDRHYFRVVAQYVKIIGRDNLKTEISDRGIKFLKKVLYD